jgi:hypothetical protein
MADVVVVAAATTDFAKMKGRQPPPFEKYL